jgi:hypothetical protein
MRWCPGLELGRKIKRSESLDLGLAASDPNVLLTSNVVCIPCTFFAVIFVSGLIEEISLN